MLSFWFIGLHEKYTPGIDNILGSQSTGFMDNWYHDMFDTGGQLGPSCFVRVNI